jgi:hypothetical protein
MLGGQPIRQKTDNEGSSDQIGECGTASSDDNMAADAGIGSPRAASDARRRS